jgi:acyl transferase domain-containing protein
VTNGRAEPLDRQAILRRALDEMKELRAQLAAADRAASEPIAIVGMSGRFPGAADLDAFWRLLRDGGDAIREVPPDRWDVAAYYDPNTGAAGKMTTRWGGFLADVASFDADFFRISPREATSMDPQQRLLLEVAWEALESAGHATKRGADTEGGVFVGISTNDYAARTMYGDPRQIDVYSATGNALNIAAGRLAYFLGFTGPALAVDTACSSSLVAVHLACRSLRSGECRIALAGGVNVILSPNGTISTSRAGMMARDGRCKTFDASADGYVRSEGCALVALKRLSDALADGDRIAAVIRGSAINQDGASSALTVPNGAAQRALVRDALAQARVEPGAIGYVEAHGTGTALGDPIEVDALTDVLAQGRGPDRRCAIGSVKTNVGHLESAAGIAGLVKTVLALEHEQIPPHLHLRTLNPQIKLEAPFAIPTTALPWARGERPRIAGVSSFGFSGTNAHVIVEEAPAVQTVVNAHDRPLHLTTLSARSETALGAAARRLLDALERDPDRSLADVAFSANAGRSHFEHRLAFVASSVAELRAQLAAAGGGRLADGVARGRAENPRPRMTLALHDAEREPGGWPALLAQLADLYVRGCEVDWADFDRDYARRRVALPAYPFERTRYWHPAASAERRDASALVDAVPHPFVRGAVRSPLPARTFTAEFALDALPLVGDHRILGMAWVNLATYLESAAAAARAAYGTDRLRLSGVTVPRGLVLAQDETRQVQIVLTPGTGDDAAASFGVYSFDEHASGGARWIAHAQGRIARLDDAARVPELSLSALRATCTVPLEPRALYAGMEAHGVALGPSCRWLAEIALGEQEALARVQAPRGEELAGDYVLHLGAVDACFQVLVALLPADAPRDYLLAGLDELAWYGAARGETLWCRATVTNTDPHTQTLTGDVTLLAASGRVVASVRGARLERVGVQARAAASTAPARPGRPRLALGDLDDVDAVARRARVERYLIEEIAFSKEIAPDLVDAASGLNEQLDSLMAVELKTRIDAELGVEIPVAAFFDGSSAGEVAAQLLDALDQRASAASAHGEDAESLARLVDAIAELSDEEAAGLLAAD